MTEVDLESGQPKSPHKRHDRRGTQRLANFYGETKNLRPLSRYAVLLMRTSPSIRTRTQAHIQNGLIGAGIPVFNTELNERDAFRAVFSSSRLSTASARPMSPISTRRRSMCGNSSRK